MKTVKSVRGTPEANVAAWLENHVAFEKLVVEPPNPIDRGTRLRSQQLAWWTSIIHMMPSTSYWDRQSIISHMQSNPPKLNQSGGESVNIEWIYPILKIDPAKFIANTQPRYIAAFAVKALLKANPEILPPELRIAGLLDEIQFADIVSKIGDENFGDIALQRLEQRLTMAQQLIMEHRQEIGALKSTGESTIKVLHEAIIAAKAQVEQVRDGAFASIESLREANASLMVIEPTVRLWMNKSEERKRSFIGGAFAFVTILALAAAAAAKHGPRYLEIIRDFQSQYVSAALVIVPILALAWVLRLVSRFTITNLALWQDAAHRSATADTYISLLSEPTKPMSEAERAIALNALFRPAPGAAVQDLDPPNLVDLVKKPE